MVKGVLRLNIMKAKAVYTKRDVAVTLGCIVFVLASLGAVGSTGRRRAKEAICLSNLLQWGRIWKSYTDDHDGYFAHRGEMVYWPEEIIGYMTSINKNIWFCPEATKTFEEGGQPPFVAWSDYDDGRRIDASYCVNLWVTNDYSSKFWRTPYVNCAAYVPLLADGNWKDAEPYETDEPPEYEGYWWEPNTNEMKRVCVNRHRGAVNVVFLDFSTRRIGLKHLWRTRWHREWDMQAPLPLWPEWMQNFEDPE
jgi:prepilin-type processing-associated H-X9-DG protein